MGRILSLVLTVTIWLCCLTDHKNAFRMTPSSSGIKPFMGTRISKYSSGSRRGLATATMRVVKPPTVIDSIPKLNSANNNNIASIAAMIPPPLTKRVYTFADIKEALALVRLKSKIDYDFWSISFPAFLGLLADPLVSLFDGVFVSRLGAAAQAGMGIATSAQYSVSKLYNDPLLKTSTSLVANKSGNELLSSIATAVILAGVIGISQCLVYLSFAGPILGLMNVGSASDMRPPALSYLFWKSLGVPAATLLIVCNGIFRGRGDTRTPLFFTTMGNVVNFLLTPILMFGCKLGIAGIGISNAISQWLTVIPVLFSLYKAFPFSIMDTLLTKSFVDSIVPYASAGGFIVLRTIAKVLALSAASSGAARLGTMPMAAYSLSYSLMFVASQLCDALAISSQSLLARDMPLDSDAKRKSAKHVISRALQSGLGVSLLLAAIMGLAKNSLLGYMTQSSEVRDMASSVMPLVMLNQVMIGLTSTLAGLLMGGHDWLWTTYGMMISALVSIAFAKLMPSSLFNVWIAVTAFNACQVLSSAGRIFSGSGPWSDLWRTDLPNDKASQQGQE
jgi:putative MATE family efflux protein